MTDDDFTRALTQILSSGQDTTSEESLSLLLEVFETAFYHLMSSPLGSWFRLLAEYVA